MSRRGGPAARPATPAVARPSADRATSGAAEGATPTAYELLRDHYFLLDRSFNRLFAAAETDGQRDALRRDYVVARDAFWEAQSRSFLEDDPLVRALEAELAAARATIEERVERLDDVAAALAAVGESVRIAGALVALGAGR